MLLKPGEKKPGLSLYPLEFEAVRQSMNRVRKSILPKANRHIAELTVQIVASVLIVKQALTRASLRDRGVTAPMRSKRASAAFEKHRELVLDQLKRRRPNKGIIKRPTRQLGRGTGIGHDAHAIWGAS